MKTPLALSRAEKELLVELEDYIRSAVWSCGLKRGAINQPGAWITRQLSLPTKTNALGKRVKIKLGPKNTSEEFFESCCINRSEHWYTMTAVYQMLRNLKKRGLLRVEGFEGSDASPPSKPTP